jgi:AhpD family alkylhydroperoxidase
MQPRIDSPVMTAPGAMQALQQFAASAKHADLPETTLLFVALRASQINGCSVCVDMHSRELKAGAGGPPPPPPPPPPAALGLTEAATRLADRSDPVSDDVWEEAARHYDDRQLGALVVAIASINAWNRINATTRQITGEWVTQWIPSSQDAAQAV